MVNRSFHSIHSISDHNQRSEKERNRRDLCRVDKQIPAESEKVSGAKRRY